MVLPYVIGTPHLLLRLVPHQVQAMYLALGILGASLLGAIIHFSELQ
jgi:hypothetical protein